mmetsp:Transcript_13297/g.22751  ORF Transcript_13297/g.22751 Transcript_13297/m.22751 type:complete len:422 (+) Transcript_13297:147-1412(+)
MATSNPSSQGAFVPQAAASLTCSFSSFLIHNDSNTLVCVHRYRQRMHAEKRQSPISCSASTPGSSKDGKILLECAKGNKVSRPPVWLMRQAGRYMAAFREYSDKYKFRDRSENPEIAVELSLQPWRAFGTDGVIMFSDILTPLPAIGVEFDILKGKGPTFEKPIRSKASVDAVLTVDQFNPEQDLRFVRETLTSLKREIGNHSTLLGFVGCPWTLAAYTMEGGGSKELKHTKSIMFSEPSILHALLEKLADVVGAYACFQIESGAEVVQFFDSWAHHLSPAQYAEFSIPYTARSADIVRKKHPNTPIIFFANGGAGKMEMVRDRLSSRFNIFGLDWSTDMADARKLFGNDVVLQGNVDPLVLLGSEKYIKAAVRNACSQAGQGHHILNVGHGVIQTTPESAVALFCEEARSFVYEKGGLLV